MSQLAFSPICPFGPRLIVAGGTPQLLFPTSEIPVAAAGIWPARASRVYIEAINTNTHPIYLGVKGMVVATLVKVIQTLPAPSSGAVVYYADWTENFSGGTNNYRLQDYWLDGTTGEGVLRTCWVW